MWTGSVLVSHLLLLSNGCWGMSPPDPAALDYTCRIPFCRGRIGIVPLTLAKTRPLTPPLRDLQCLFLPHVGEAVRCDGRRHPQGRGADRGAALHPHLPRPADGDQAGRQRDGGRRRARRHARGRRLHGHRRPAPRPRPRRRQAHRPRHGRRRAGAAQGPRPPLHRPRHARHRRPRPDAGDQRRHRRADPHSSAAAPSACTRIRCLCSSASA